MSCVCKKYYLNPFLVLSSSHFSQKFTYDDIISISLLSGVKKVRRGDQTKTRFDYSPQRVKMGPRKLLTSGKKKVKMKRKRLQRKKNQTTRNFTCKRTGGWSRLATYTATFNKREERYGLPECSVKTTTIT